MLVSVYITTKDRLELLKRAVASVLSQDYKKIELIVSDDGSSDGTHEYLLEQEKQGHLKAIIRTDSKGACFARNLAIDLAQGEFITGLDDDDYFKPQRVSCFVQFWSNLDNSKKTTIAGLFDSIIELGVNGQLVKDDAEEASYLDLRKSNLVGNQVFAKKEVFVGAAKFDVEMPAWQDWDMWIRMSKKYGSFLNIREQTYFMDLIHDHGRLSTKKSERIRLAYHKIVEKLGTQSYTERVAMLEKLYGYHQMTPKLSEVLILLSYGKVRPVVRSIRTLIRY
ncbi:glycosyltransferase [Vibrio europaeus]|uniref:glycosyltransferase n=1 Tax=Vibrio europaeus TaxID=300876 RepID=UPI00233F8F7F|nr:glycosyltransferase [Vibrio europaeus]MDC5852100.1 glycosyltransferase [Vibrio europaeus]